MLVLPFKSKCIKKIISELDDSKQPGLDGIRARDLKLLKDKISKIITKLVNISLVTGQVPNNLKISIVRPVNKKGDHLLLSNYRPIAIMCVIEKIIERCIYLKLTNYLQQHGIINKFQYGFQKNKSTSDLLSLFSNYVNSKLNDNHHIVALFVDFSKAFDTINHEKLIIALENAGVRGPMLTWFCNDLLNRHYLVKVGFNYSFKMPYNHGVPQGSILGPVLYLIYVNSMIENLKKCQSYMYADDTVLMSSHKDIVVAERRLLNDFNN